MIWKTCRGMPDLGTIDGRADVRHESVWLVSGLSVDHRRPTDANKSFTISQGMHSWKRTLRKCRRKDAAENSARGGVAQGYF